MPKLINEKAIFIAATPVLVLYTTQDSATPYEWAKSLIEYTFGSGLVTLKGEGHPGYGRSSVCTDDAVNSYLLSRKTQIKDITGNDQDLFVRVDIT